MEVLNLSPGGFACACYLVYKQQDAVLIDCSVDADILQRELALRQLRLHAILCTHGHFDHILTADAVRKQCDVPLFLHQKDADMPADGIKNAYSVFFGKERCWQPAQRLFADGDTLTFGDLTFTVMHTPGHTAGSSVFVCDNTVFTGDTLFVHGYGRTDLYSGDGAQLRRSLQALSLLPPTHRIYPGHGSPAVLEQALSRLF